MYTHFLSWSTIPDLCLQNIMEHVPLHDLLCTIPLTCSRWHSLKPRALLHKRSLTLLICDEGCSLPLNMIRNNPFAIPHVDQIEQESQSSMLHINEHKLQFTQLHLPILTNQLVNKLIDLFPRIESLQIVIQQGTVQNDLELFDLVLLLLNHWSQHFKTLQLHFESLYEVGDRTNDRVRKLIDTINHSLPSLRRLLLHLYMINYAYNQTEPELDLPILSRLEECFLNIGCPGWSSISILNSLKKYAEPNKSLRQIGFTCTHNDRFKTIFCESTLLGKLVSLTLFRLNLNQLEGLVSMLGSISSLHCFLARDQNLSRLSRSLAQLPNLKYLRLSTVEYEFKISYSDQAQLVPLPSVNTFVMLIMFNTIERYQFSIISRMVPAVKVVIIDHSISPHYWTNFPTDWSVECAHVLPASLRPFKQNCPLLKKIVLSGRQTNNFRRTVYMEHELDIEQV